MKRFVPLLFACAWFTTLVFVVPGVTLADQQGRTASASAGSAQGQATPDHVRISLANAKDPFDVLAPGSPEMAPLYMLARDGFVKNNLSVLDGHTSLTRYQASLIAAEAITNAETMLHDAKPGTTLNPRDLAALQQTFENFKDLLAAQGDRVDGLAGVVAQQPVTTSDAQTSAAAPDPPDENHPPAFELHGEFRVRPVNAYSQNAAGTSPGGVALPAGTTFVRTGAVGDNGTAVPIGDIGFGQEQARLRLVGTGHIGDNATFIVRLSAEENAGDTGSPVAGGALGAWVHNDFDFFDYNVPKTGLDVFGGKLLYCCNTPWLPDGSGLIADAVPIGVAAKWTSPGGRFSAWGSVGSLKNAETAPTQVPPNGVGLTQNITAFHVGGSFGMLSVGGQYFALNSQAVTNFVNGKPVFALGPVSVGSLWLGFTPARMLSGQLEVLNRFGNDPTTGKGWDGPTAFLFDLNFGGGNQYQSAGRFRFASTGKNSALTGLDPIINGVDSMWNAQFLNRSTNLQLFEVGYSYHFDKNGHLDLDYGNAQLGSAETGFDGSRLTKDQHSLFVVTTGFNF